jgi:hypothetical protein
VLAVPERIVSGGQTGADRAALDWAIANGMPHGGWCPKGRTAEDGPIDARYRLEETAGTAYLQRTDWNVRDSDATVIFTVADRLSCGSRHTAECAAAHGRPCLHLASEHGDADAAHLLRQFVVDHGVQILNVAGSRASEEPAVGEFVKATLDRAFGRS